MYAALVVALVDLLGLVLICRIRRLIPTQHIAIIAGVWVIVLHIILAWMLTRNYVLALNANDNLPVDSLALCGLFSLVIVLYGISKFWPIDNLGLGFVINKGMAKSIGIGIISGCILAAALTNVFTQIGARHYMYSELVLCSSIIPISILEEAIFRSRIMDIIASRVNDNAILIVLQSIVFVIAHIHGMISFRYSGITGMLRPLAIIFIIGIAFGFLRLRRKHLWGSTFAHIAYNVLVLYSAVSV